MANTPEQNPAAHFGVPARSNSRKALPVPYSSVLTEIWSHISSDGFLKFDLNQHHPSGQEEALASAVVPAADPRLSALICGKFSKLEMVALREKTQSQNRERRPGLVLIFEIATPPINSLAMNH